MNQSLPIAFTNPIIGIGPVWLNTYEILCSLRLLENIPDIVTKVDDKGIEPIIQKLPKSWWESIPNAPQDDDYQQIEHFNLYDPDESEDPVEFEWTKEEETVYFPLFHIWIGLRLAERFALVPPIPMSYWEEVHARYKFDPNIEIIDKCPEQ